MNARRWFFAAAVTVEAVGIATALVALIVPGALAAITKALFWTPVAFTFDAPARLLGGIGGAVMAGWGAAMAQLARNLHALTPVAVGRAFATGTLLWFFLDGAVSIACGAYLNLPGNLLFLVLLLVPSLVLGRDGTVPSHRAP
jgi:hypothetical protein